MAFLTDNGPSDRADDTRGTLNLAERCPLIDGVTDNTACIQAAVDVICARPDGGGTLVFPPGAPTINAALGVHIGCSGVTLRGAGFGDRDRNSRATRITVIGRGDAAIFDFVGPPGVISRYAYGGTVEDLAFYASNDTGAGRRATQTGPMVRWTRCTGCLMRNVYAWNPFRFVVNIGGYLNRVTQVQAEAIALDGEAILYAGTDATCGTDIGSCATRGDIFSVDHSSFYAMWDDKQPRRNTAVCIHVRDFVATTWLQNIACNQAHVGLFVDCPTSHDQVACPAFISAFDFETEPNGIVGDEHAAGISVEDVQEFTCTSCYVHGYGVTTDVRLRQGRFDHSADVQFTGGKFDAAKGDCIDSDISSLTIIGGIVGGCGTEGRGGVGLHIRAPARKTAASGGTIIQGVHFCLEGAQVPTGMEPVQLDLGVDWTLVQSNLFRGCTGGVVNHSSGAHNLIGPNLGP